jgi:hypothetical protein
MLDLTLISVMIAVATSVILNLRNYPLYRVTYVALLTGAVKLNRLSSDKTIAYFDGEDLASAWESSSPNPWIQSFVIYFRKGRDVRLLGGGYIHNTLPTYFDPYALYWLFKLRRILDPLSEGEDPARLRRDHRISAIIGGK